MSTSELHAVSGSSAADRRSVSWYEASARQRVQLLLDPGSFREFIGPEMREVSPHLQVFDLPEQFDDGIVAGRGRINGAPVFVAAQEGPVHGRRLRRGSMAPN